MKIACVYSNSVKAKNLFQNLSTQYSFVEPKDADIILCLGGDGFLLHTMHKYVDLNTPIYGINCGSVGFLLNKYDINENLLEIIKQSKTVDIHPLEAIFTYNSGKNESNFAFNEVSILRNTSSTSHLSISIDSLEKMPKLIGDGVLVATPSGSTSYNRACGGNLISINSDLLVLTPINPFSPLGWRGATLGSQHTIEIKVLSNLKRTVSICCDFKEYKDISNIKIKLAKHKKISLLFNKKNDLENKILQTQFNR